MPTPTTYSFGALVVLACLPPAVAQLQPPTAPPPAQPPITRAAGPAIAALSAAAAGTEYSIAGTTGGPTDQEVLVLEYINRARRAPAAEGLILRNTTDPDVLFSYQYYKVDLAMVVSEFQALSPAQPVAFNGQLINAARAHAQDMFDHAFQAHVGSNGSTTGQRLTTAGYPYSVAGENIYAFCKSGFYGHAGFEVDWGPGSGGMQDGRGHRVNIHNPAFKEVGVGVIEGTNTVGSTTVGPQVLTHEFGARSGTGPFLTGVAYYDFSGDSFYTPGEGLGGITVTVSGATNYAVTTSSGAFTVPLPGAGTYNVAFSGLGANWSASVTSTGDNVKVDYIPTYVAPTISGPATATVGVVSTYSFGSVAGANGYSLRSLRLGTGPVSDNAENASGVTATVSSYNPVQTAVKAQGAAAYNLYHPDGSDQVLVLNRVLFPRAGASLSFASRLGAATTEETAQVQVSVDGTTWTSVYEQKGTDGAGETAFATRTVDLSAYTGKPLSVRFRYSVGARYVSGGSAVGWFIDSIQANNADEVLESTVTDLGAATTFTFSPASAGGYGLAITPRNSAHPMPAGAVFEVKAGAGSATGASAYLSNLSIRAAMSAGQTLIVGFVVDQGSKPILLRAAGPALTKYGLSGLGDPHLALYSGSTVVTENEDWSANLASVFPSVGAFPFESGSKDAALLQTLAGAYTAWATGPGSGTVLVEAYDAGTNSGPHFSNLSARFQVGTGDNILIAGFAVSGTGTKQLLVRAVGPTLAKFGVSGALADPQLTVLQGTTIVASNNDWPASLAPTFASVGAFPLQDPKDAATLVSVEAGKSYTVQVSGVGNTTGEALIEVYELK